MFYLIIAQKNPAVHHRRIFFDVNDDASSPLLIISLAFLNLNFETEE